MENQILHCGKPSSSLLKIRFLLVENRALDCQENRALTVIVENRALDCGKSGS